MRERKPETIIRELRSDLKRALHDKGTYHDEAFALRHRASRAEAECAEWKNRFDVLLFRLERLEPPDPVVPDRGEG